jgi:hypothetical protein
MVHFANENAASSTPSDDARCSTNIGAQQAADRHISSVVVNGLSADLARAAELEQLGDSIAELAAHMHAATYRLLVMLAEFDRRGGWGGGFRSCAHWLSWRTRIGPGAAREKVRVARALEHLPELSDALRRGELSYAVVRAVTRVATPQNEAELLELARRGTASHVERVVRAWRRVDRLEEQWAERERHRSRCLHLYPDDDGMYVLRGRLSPEVGALLERALAAAGEALYERPKESEQDHQPAVTDATPYTQRQADAIGLLAEWALGGTPVLDTQPQGGMTASENDEAAPENAAAQLAEERTTQPEVDEAGSEDDPIACGGEVVPQPKEESVHAENEATGSDDDPIACGGEAMQLAEEAWGHAENEPTARELDESATVEAVEPASRKRPVTVGRAERFQVVVHVDAEALRAGSDSGQAVLAGGIRVSAETARRISCDASRVVMIHDKEGNVLDVGRRTRIVPTAIRRALDYRDRGCRFPGCGLRFCDAHHIAHWIDGGTTKLTNLVLLCRRHHRAVHEEGFGVHISATGEISFTRPDGRPLPDAPALPQLPEDCVDRLIAAQQDLEIDAWTPTPDWHGERLDLDFAIRALRAL